MKKTRYIVCCLLCAVMQPAPVAAKGEYQQPQDFIKESFSGQVPEPQLFWITKQYKRSITEILGHRPSSLRLRYWRRQQKSVWVLSEIGKEKDITVGIVINGDQIEKIKILVFRESRGWEVRYPFFTEQFSRAKIKSNNQLDKTIDNITGATLSVRAVKKLARLALYLSKHSRNNHDAP